MLILMCAEKVEYRIFEGVKQSELAFKDHFLKTFLFQVKGDGREGCYSCFLDFID